MSGEGLHRKEVGFAVGLVSRLLLLVLLASCGGGSSGGNDLAPPVVKDESPAGLWLGPITSTIDTSITQVVGAVSVNNDAQFVAATVSERHYAGTLATAGNVLVGTLNVYRGKAGPFFGAAGLDSINVDGTALERTLLSADFSGDDEGQFSLSYVVTYEDASSLGLIAGTWLYSEPSAAGPLYTVTLDIDGSGAIFGTDSEGCVYSGQAGLIDAAFNAYSVAISVSECRLQNGDYSGLGWITSVDGGLQNNLTLGLNAEERAFAASLLRL
jgi:hypothetical protein